MNAQEKRIARAIRASQRKTRWQKRKGEPEIDHVRVRLHPDGSYDYVTGPEHQHMCGRKRRVYSLRHGCHQPDFVARYGEWQHPGTAAGGWSGYKTREEAIAVLLRK